MVGDKLPGGKEIRWLHLGAAHKACFMVFALCSFKILALSHLQEVQDKCFSKKVKRGLIFDKKTLKNLWQWGQYAVKCDIPQFLLTSLGRDAPINGLNRSRPPSSTGSSGTWSPKRRSLIVMQLLGTI